MSKEDNLKIANAKLEMIQTKLNRWQKIVDGTTVNAQNPLVQQARDETMQDCITTIQMILNADGEWKFTLSIPQRD